jgi:hypothetical protein
MLQHEKLNSEISDCLLAARKWRGKFNSIIKSSKEYFGFKNCNDIIRRIINSETILESGKR